MQKLIEIAETYTNGNISVASESIKKLNKKELLELALLWPEYTEYNHEDALGLILRLLNR